MQAQSPIEAQGQWGLEKYKPCAYRRDNTVYRIAGYFNRGKFSPLPEELYYPNISPEIFSPLIR